ncbi:hypothetical protein HMPREF1981_00847 [Bacteroides pyogenes F0041]|uniref:Uncharacterized protein n=1 Tax=Bacteroides pyogenes F0041 TaxID=1321819 RepID=U2E2T2_9BACE|nr:hypothetical protein HMPREF1981_00847 [Bacteroides pyogenes F0041]
MYIPLPFIRIIGKSLKSGTIFPAIRRHCCGQSFFVFICYLK